MRKCKVESLSVVIPVYNDEEVLEELLKRLTAAVEPLADNCEILLVDDGSKDNSWTKIMELAGKYPQLTGIKLSRNFGQQNAITAGFSHASGDVIILMDSDLQDRPEDIGKLLDALLENNTQMAIAQWEERKDSFFKVFVSKMFYLLSSSWTTLKIQPRLGGFRAIKRSVIDELKNFPENTSTTISLLYYIGANYVTVPLKRDARFAGSSGYNLSKMFSLAMSRLLSFSLFPIRLVTFSGIIISAISIIFGLFLILRQIFGQVAPGWTSLSVLILFLFGLNFAFLGIIGEYIGKIFMETKRRPKFLVECVYSKKSKNEF